MEKGNAHYPLPKVHSLCDANPPQVSVTSTAMAGAVSLGFPNLAAIIAVVKQLEKTHLHKSMTTHADHKVWQDVYKISTPQGRVYIKLTVLFSEDMLKVVSFKEDESSSK